MQNTKDLFEHDFADVLSRDAVMERGMVIALDATCWVRIDRRGVFMLHKQIKPSGVVTLEEWVSALPMLPLSIHMLHDQPFLQVLYGTRSGALRIDTVLLDAVVKPEQHARTLRELAERGFDLDREEWADLAHVLRLVMKTCNADHSLPVEQVSTLKWEVQGNFLVPRKQTMRVIQGGLSGQDPMPHRQLTISTLRPV